MKNYFLTLTAIACCAGLTAKSFVTELDGLRNIVLGTVKGQSVLFLSEVDGGVGCYTTAGKKLWIHDSLDPAVMFEIEAYDVDGDGSDELLAASADGNIYCWSGDGNLNWSFNPGYKVRFSELAALKIEGETRVFAGGNNFKFYELSSKGKLLSETPIKGVVRLIAAGNFRSADEESLFVMTYTHDKFNWNFFGLIDPKSKRIQKKITVHQAPHKDWRSLMINDFGVQDIDADGLDDLLVFGTPKASKAMFIAVNGEFEEIAKFVGPHKDKQRYAHLMGECLLPSRPEIALQYGGVMYRTDLKGNLLERSGERHGEIIYNDFAHDAKSKTLFGGGQIGGGNAVYEYPLSKKNWMQTKHEFVGRFAEVEENLNTLYEQALAFERPDYQEASENPWVMITSIKPTKEVQKKKGSEILFVKQYTWHEDFDRGYLVEALGEQALKRDGRGKYTKTRKEMVAVAKDHEKRGEPFTVWTGHGNDPFYVSIESMEAILKAAPNTCYGFVYAEMSNPEDERYHYFIEHYVPRLAKAMRVMGKAKLYFRYKNVFWAASSHLDPWNELFFSGKYSDILVPSSEDTNSRTQDINFAGRVGMLAGGYVSDVAMRLVDDNPTCWRPQSPGGQRSVSPYLRNGAILAAYGARSGILFNIGYLEDPGMNVLFALMKSELLPEVKPEDILSIGSWHLMKDVDEELVHGIDAGHTMELYTPEDEEAVFSVGQVNWCGTSVPDHDFSKVLGVDYRWLNFVPEMPNGMVPIAPIEYGKQLDKAGMPYTVSDSRAGYVDGKKVPASEFGSELNKVVGVGAKTMPVRVSGASWCAIRLDDSHVRLILVDPGYIDPQEREVTVKFQSKQPKSAKDILSGERLKTKKSELKLTVPAGSLRFVDLAY
ncbi:hypothetical protein [Pelagicoccus mobilis]|uniref:Lambda-carrageenase n=1 Tax=Pelagicoccus mobilis TaxID=415221 RepID=A0A934RXN7_9BACT|nr:hypothetical protein [Pelagicoccus mobilis]MBK1875784.1 hypothetical protein [Pelagicoccus mobilis]